MATISGKRFTIPKPPPGALPTISLGTEWEKLAWNFVPLVPELFPVKLLERIHFGSVDIFILQTRQDFTPPLLVSASHFPDHLRIFGNDIPLFSGVVYQVVQLIVVHQLEPRVPN